MSEQTKETVIILSEQEDLVFVKDKTINDKLSLLLKFNNENLCKKVAGLVDFRLLIKRVDTFSLVEIGYDRYLDCRIIESSNDYVKISCVHDSFYNKSKKDLSKIRPDIISNLLEKLN